MEIINRLEFCIRIQLGIDDEKLWKLFARIIEENDELMIIIRLRLYSCVD